MYLWIFVININSFISSKLTYWKGLQQKKNFSNQSYLILKIYELANLAFSTMISNTVISNCLFLLMRHITESILLPATYQNSVRCFEVYFSKKNDNHKMKLYVLYGIY